MQPISTSRSPWRGSSPVVSVSNTISRMLVSSAVAVRAESFPPDGHLSDCYKNLSHLRPGVLDSLRAVHYEIRPPPFLGVRHLARQQGFQPFHLDAALDQPCALHLGRPRR